jgi:hypothetical protein
MATLESACEIRWYDNEKIQVQTLERIFCVFHACVSVSDIEIHVLGKRIDEVTAFCCVAFVHDAHTQITDLRVQGESENNQHDGGRQQSLTCLWLVAPASRNSAWHVGIAPGHVLQAG